MSASSKCLECSETADSFEFLLLAHAIKTNVGCASSKCTYVLNANSKGPGEGAWLLAYAILKTTANAVSLSMQVEKALARLRKCLCSKTQICLLVSSIDNFCKQIGTRPGRTKGRA